MYYYRGGCSGVQLRIRDRIVPLLSYKIIGCTRYLFFFVAVVYDGCLCFFHLRFRNESNGEISFRSRARDRPRGEKEISLSSTEALTAFGFFFSRARASLFLRRRRCRGAEVIVVRGWFFFFFFACSFFPKFVARAVYFLPYDDDDGG